MPTFIEFTAQDPRSKAGGGRVRVKEEPEDVVQELGASQSGFAGFALANNPKQTIWVNRDHVLSLRRAK